MIDMNDFKDLAIVIMAGLGTGGTLAFGIVLSDWRQKLITLHKTGTLITKKGVYTFRHG